MKRSKQRQRHVWPRRGGLLAAVFFAGTALAPAHAQVAAAADTEVKPRPVRAPMRPAAASRRLAPRPRPPAGSACNAGDRGHGRGAGDRASRRVQEIVVTATRHEAALSKVRSASARSPRNRWMRKDQGLHRRCALHARRKDRRNRNRHQCDLDPRHLVLGRVRTTGIYIDDTPIQIHSLGFNGDDSLPKTFDLERVEVLRAAGDAVRAGSEGGTVRYILTQPSLNKSSLYARSEVAFTQGGDPATKPAWPRAYP